MTVDMSDYDKAMERYEEKTEIVKNLRDQGKLSLTEIAAVTKLSEKTIQEL